MGFRLLKESDLHTKRTGHLDFTDKTLEAAKPIELEASKVPTITSEDNAAGAVAVASESGQSEGNSFVSMHTAVLVSTIYQVHNFLCYALFCKITILDLSSTEISMFSMNCLPGFS